MVAALDAQQTVRYWNIAVDPRLIRGEFSDAAGNLQKHVDYRTDALLSVTLPDGIDAVEIRILSPSWQSGELRLLPVGQVNLPVGERR